MSTPKPAEPQTNSASRRDAAVDWLFSRINYERVAVLPYNERQLKLDRMRQLLTRLGSPDARLRIVHVAGSKGKGSTSAMIAAVLTAAGLKTGVYSSPHLERIEERWAIDGAPIGAEELVGLVERVRLVVEAMDAESDAQDEPLSPPTFFDITTAMALLHFADRECDAAILEVGLGGRLDSTNVCLPVVSVITSISLDHTKQLGDTLAAIAGEKAGIIKPGVPVVSGVVEPEPSAVIARTARENGCRLVQRDEDFGAQAGPQNGFCYWREAPTHRLADLRLRLIGEHQLQNAAVALAVVDELEAQGWPITDHSRRAGLAAACLPARVEWFPAIAGVRPAVVVDAAHNEASSRALVESLPSVPAKGPRTLVLAVSRDKQVEAIACTLAPAFDRVLATRFLENPRAVAPDLLAELIGAEKATVVGDPAKALRVALNSTPEDGVVVITGSFFIAAELRPLLPTK